MADSARGPADVIARPARCANLARNLLAHRDREQRWRPARDALWALLDRHIPAGAAVAVVGAGHAHDLPLTRLLARAGTVDLIDLARGPSRGALRREPAGLRVRGRALSVDITGGAADRVVRAARRGRLPRHATVPATRLARRGYDVIVGDLLYTQLLYPGLLDQGLSRERIGDVLATHGQRLCDGVIARLHTSADVVVHVHDRLGWWPGHTPAPDLAELLTSPNQLRDQSGPQGCDVERAVSRAGAVVVDRRFWRWPFDDNIEYLVEAIVAVRDEPSRRPIE